jgi:O-antigen/teichoic acid export membrane protein
LPENITSSEILTGNAAPSTRGLTAKVFKGSLWTLVGQVLPMLASLVSTPFVIRFLGSEAYGVLILVGLIPYYFAFADF